MKNFLVKLFIYSVVIAAIDFCWIRFMPIEKHIPHVWLMLIFFVATTTVFHYFSLQQAKGKPQGFIRYYMGSTALRLFLYILVIAAYGFYDKSTVILFAIGFMLHYFFFTAFEVSTLLKELKKS